MHDGRAIDTFCFMPVDIFDPSVSQSPALQPLEQVVIAVAARLRDAVQPA
jgi:hypothetical protein